MKNLFGARMTDLNKDIVMECYNKLHSALGPYMIEECLEEGIEAAILLMSTAIQTKCLFFKANVEHTLEDAFDSIADYTHGMLEDEDG